MKRTLLSIITITAFGFAVNAQNVNIPDANFKAFLVGDASINTNADTEIQTSEAIAFSGTINCSNLSISDLTGIEAFTTLDNLNCSNNPLGSIDVSLNSALTVLDLSASGLTSLDISSNTALIRLYSQNNSQLSTLNLTTNTSLTILYCANNSLTSLNLSTLTLLEILSCGGNGMTSINLLANANLSELYCADNSLVTLELSANSALVALDCSNNLLTTLNVANGNNVNVYDFFVHANSNLTCIQVDDVAYSTTNWVNIDAGVSFSTNCGVGINEQTNNINLSIYPNPTTSQLTIHSDEKIKSIIIVNAMGKIVKTIIPISNTIDVTDLASGIYFLQIQTDKASVNKNFIKK